MFSVDAFMNYSDGELIVTGPNATAHIFATYPASDLSLISGFADQVSTQRKQTKHPQSCYICCLDCRNKMLKNIKLATKNYYKSNNCDQVYRFGHTLLCIIVMTRLYYCL